jgi:hypothetical protein
MVAMSCQSLSHVFHQPVQTTEVGRRWRHLFRYVASAVWHAQCRLGHSRVLSVIIAGETPYMFMPYNVV